MPNGNVRFRFYAQLNDFLPAERRGRRFDDALAAPRSVKDAIEALGIPHPEVDLILVNGTPQGFEYGLQDGDDVSVYPVFRSIDVAGVQRAGIDPPQPVQFMLDLHLSKLASLLRLCGFDAVSGSDDEDLVREAAREGRVVLTRDLGLLKRAAVRYGYWVRHTYPESQLLEVLERFDLAGRMDPFTRCLRCNTRLVSADADAVADRLAPRTRAAFRQFQQCPGCARVYWRGSHFDRLAGLVERARTGAPPSTQGPGT